MQYAWTVWTIDPTGFCVENQAVKFHFHVHDRAFLRKATERKSGRFDYDTVLTLSTRNCTLVDFDFDFVVNDSYNWCGTWE